MSKVWDNCTACGRDLATIEAESWRECTRCHRFSVGVLFFLIALSVLIWVPLFRFGFRLNLFLSNLGLTLDLIGAWFLATGYTDIYAMSAGGWDGAESAYRKFGFKHFMKRTLGIGLLGLGFALQGLGNWLSAGVP